ncbi:secondary thiamine-phosphate synthase enzyme YjbQ [Candidatus Absconditicoccus praedator]|uniref:secondary thiamine-phosphate synthase enzyme YjbQ n=1 Tax=Candidatus Absconditicoccus praedator TaxID=2735562 RepID=UPI001E6563B9|nr:secondary thiamine-phosphate synthase enzyme YjbQ [Candidatus Absconditicoccus praedator]UFX82906.1 YjbQ family protein [Candidatus Absconditicoccus praedator]
MFLDIMVSTTKRNEFIDITNRINQKIKENEIQEGICTVYTPHTTCGITINEGADPDVMDDIQRFLDNKIWSDPIYKHAEGNSDSHIKSSLLGVSQQIIIFNQKLLLGTWQKVFFGEFDGPRQRKVFLKLING